MLKKQLIFLMVAGFCGQSFAKGVPPFLETFCPRFALSSISKTFDSSWQVCNLPQLIAKTDGTTEKSIRWLRGILTGKEKLHTYYTCRFIIKKNNWTHSAYTLMKLFDNKTTALENHYMDTNLMDVKKVTYQGETKYMAVIDYRMVFYTLLWGETCL